jgi:hypothetical protein
MLAGAFRTVGKRVHSRLTSVTCYIRESREDNAMSIIGAPRWAWGPPFLATRDKQCRKPRRRGVTQPSAGAEAIRTD